MLTKRTTKNQITLPKPVAARFDGVQYFEVSTDGATIVLRPVVPSRADMVREKLALLGITQDDVTAAVQWARENP
ncbi:MAG TPA: hypothetical protein VG267_21320 [Terracidiphilus sp.]|jgi:hypothetical protein|nr:hypothetical protein [Terracidiphilus sp.]